MSHTKNSVLSLVARVPAVTIPTLEALAVLPTLSARYRSFYKRFYKLRRYLPSEITSAYVSYLRRRFDPKDYGARRKQLLGLEDPLSEKELLERCQNTLAFVFNATVVPENQKQHMKPVFYDDLKVAKDRPELQVVRTIVEVESRKPRTVLADTEWSWVPEIQAQIGGNDSEWTKNRRRTTKVVNIGLLNHDRNVMRLNESLQMCL